MTAYIEVHVQSKMQRKQIFFSMEHGAKGNYYAMAFDNTNIKSDSNYFLSGNILILASKYYQFQAHHSLCLNQGFSVKQWPFITELFCNEHHRAE